MAPGLKPQTTAEAEQALHKQGSKKPCISSSNPSTRARVPDSESLVPRGATSQPATLMEAAAPIPKKRKSEALNNDESLPPPPPHGAGEEEEGSSRGRGDRISGLPDAILGEIITLLPTKDDSRTQVLAPRWAHLWRSALLNLDCRDLPAGAVSRILSAHSGPGRRLCVPAEHLLRRPATVDSWLMRSPALDNLQEIDIGSRRRSAPAVEHVERARLPPSTFRFSATLRVATIFGCFAVVPGRTFHLPQLKQLALVHVGISQASLHTLISGCPALEYLLLDEIFYFNSLRINSNTLRGICVRTASSFSKRSQQLVVEDAPCLERLLCADDAGSSGLDVSVNVGAAPKLEIMGCARDRSGSSRNVFGSTVFQGWRAVSLTTVAHNVKILSVHSWIFNLDMAIDIMRCFPCLEKLYMKGSVSGTKNLWRRKHSHFVHCSDIRLKTLVLEDYRGTKSQVNFASFFLFNARELQLMRLEVAEGKRRNQEFLEKQRMLFQMQKWASQGARLEFATNGCLCPFLRIRHVRDLSIVDPFQCRCCSSVDA